MDPLKAKYLETTILALMEIGPMSPAGILELVQWAQRTTIVNGAPQGFEMASMNDIFDMIRSLTDSRRILQIAVRSGGHDHQMFVLPEPQKTEDGKPG